ncbi:MAG: YceI family protein, partial [Phenylobacterium sp.]
PVPLMLNPGTEAAPSTATVYLIANVLGNPTGDVGGAGVLPEHQGDLAKVAQWDPWFRRRWLDYFDLYEFLDQPQANDLTSDAARLAPQPKATSPRAWPLYRVDFKDSGAADPLPASKLLNALQPDPDLTKVRIASVAEFKSKMFTEAVYPATTETAAKSSRWRVEPGGTLGFATSWSGQDIQGRFKRWTAEIDFDPGAPEKAKLKVEVDIASIDTGDAQRDQMLPAPDWFDVDAHPKAVFTARGFEPRGDGRYVARGTLSLRGVSRPFALPFRLEIDGDTARARGVTSLDRTAFGIGQGEWTSTDQIPAQVELRVNLRARRISP